MENHRQLHSEDATDTNGVSYNPQDGEMENHRPLHSEDASNTNGVSDSPQDGEMENHRQLNSEDATDTNGASNNPQDGEASMENTFENPHVEEIRMTRTTHSDKHRKGFSIFMELLGWQKKISHSTPVKMFSDNRYILMCGNHVVEALLVREIENIARDHPFQNNEDLSKDQEVVISEESTEELLRQMEKEGLTMEDLEDLEKILIDELKKYSEIVEENPPSSTQQQEAGSGINSADVNNCMGDVYCSATDPSLDTNNISSTLNNGYDFTCNGFDNIDNSCLGNQYSDTGVAPMAFTQAGSGMNSADVNNSMGDVYRSAADPPLDANTIFSTLNNAGSVMNSADVNNSMRDAYCSAAGSSSEANNIFSTLNNGYDFTSNGFDNFDDSCLGNQYSDTGVTPMAFTQAGSGINSADVNNSMGNVYCSAADSSLEASNIFSTVNNVGNVTEEYSKTSIDDYVTGTGSLGENDNTFGSIPDLFTPELDLDELFTSIPSVPLGKHTEQGKSFEEHLQNLSLSNEEGLPTHDGSYHDAAFVSPQNPLLDWSVPSTSNDSGIDEIIHEENLDNIKSSNKEEFPPSSEMVNEMEMNDEIANVHAPMDVSTNIRNDLEKAKEEVKRNKQILRQEVKEGTELINNFLQRKEEVMLRAQTDRNFDHLPNKEKLGKEFSWVTKFLLAYLFSFRCSDIDLMLKFMNLFYRLMVRSYGFETKNLENVAKLVLHQIDTFRLVRIRFLLSKKQVKRYEIAMSQLIALYFMLSVKSRKNSMTKEDIDSFATKSKELIDKYIGCKSQKLDVLCWASLMLVDHARQDYLQHIFILVKALETDFLPCEFIKYIILGEIWRKKISAEKWQECFGDKLIPPQNIRPYLLKVFKILPPLGGINITKFLENFGIKDGKALKKILEEELENAGGVERENVTADNSSSSKTKKNLKRQNAGFSDEESGDEESPPRKKRKNNKSSSSKTKKNLKRQNARFADENSGDVESPPRKKRKNNKDFASKEEGIQASTSQAGGKKPFHKKDTTKDAVLKEICEFRVFFLEKVKRGLYRKYL